MTVHAHSDILILGAGPAGAAAALFAVRHGLHVTILDRSAPAPPEPRIEWLHPDAARLLEPAGIALQPIQLGMLNRVKFVDPATGRSVASRLDGHMPTVDSVRLAEKLLHAATAAGATLVPDTEITTVAADETAVTLQTSAGLSWTGRFLIAADGYDSVSVLSLGLDRPRASRAGYVCCQGSARKAHPSAKPGPEATDELAWVLTAEDLSSFGYAYYVRRDLVFGMIAPWAAATPRGETRSRFLETVADWRKGGILPERLDFDPANVEIRPLPRGLALDLETHVGKHSLVIGDAGGFVVAVSHEGLYPALAGASLAAEICAKALKSAYPQDVLAEFDARWRQDLVGFLRLPDADLRFLMPLIFTNERIARRLGNWLLCGKTTANP